MDLQLTGARAVVTGGSGGLGLAVARELLGEGARVLLAARDPDRLRTAADHLGSDRVLTVPTDTTDDASVRAMVGEVVAAWGGVDVLVNAAAEPSPATPPALADLTDREIHRELDTKLMGYLRCARAVAPHMTAQGRGRIVNVSGLNTRRTGSIAGTVRNVAVAALTANLADELGPAGVGVTVVHPGLVGTDRVRALVTARAAATGETEDDVLARLAAGTSLHRLVTAEEVAAVVAFLCSPRAAGVTGDAVTVAAGNRGSVHY
ncbi:SDR family NAD(P)-dependent oxidoreductase [Pseudonocardia endophytica]|uniref:NADP-dependent 3-hydroxy acid dehydrogenase YdfG n=1 Tax=Pseudonocardia endophytica TaxID=401976 RepID=A0A4R1HIQ6_PSEEN|nr:SDR family oxidoreductase [Pseudonocardia endophytica]TCK22174.1 NADP-dependent 3-hydroxy acid dehydrogenase YdfG [Pseudonocardia endophytica]